MSPFRTAAAPRPTWRLARAEHAPAAAEAVRRTAGGNPQEVESAVRRLIFAWHLDWARFVLRRLGLLCGVLFVGSYATAASSLETRLLHDAEGAVGLLTMRQFAAPVPAVILVYDSPGTDRRAELTVRQLLDAGIAALEVELYHVSADGADGPVSFNPQAEADVLDRAWQVLAAQPGIDATRLAALGFGRGAHAVAVWPGGKERDWTARVLLYPDCASLAGALPGSSGVSRAPVLVLHGDTGAGLPPRDCLHLASHFEDAGVPVRILHYRGATHGWDLPPVGEHVVSFQPAPVGRGMLRTVAWPELAEMSATQAVGFLAAAMLER
ncbi:dienelactone hydrolase family protein [Falsiroseomonas oryzae]|uniref:dienelactone hydrolase family protein n=1 Tax=Falsiroseomonas oryzae TaxID=2766473 RepID=UPI0022EA1FC6|nr:dienelactone hydrolase family protein [Roseomonas sp. MO-31]